LSDLVKEREREVQNCKPEVAFNHDIFKTGQRFKVTPPLQQNTKKGAFAIPL